MGRHLYLREAMFEICQHSFDHSLLQLTTWRRLTNALDRIRIL